jgi:hypothetical protein
VQAVRKLFEGESFFHGDISRDEAEKVRDSMQSA